MLIDFNDHTALVITATSEIGSVVARVLGARGASVLEQDAAR